MMKKILLLFSLFYYAIAILAQVPAGYYASASGKSGKNLKTALHHIISQHEERTYKELWTDFQKTDSRMDGKVWDMYSNSTNYIFFTDQNTGQYKKEGDNYNREHSFPKSWFHDEYPMYTDLFHLIPTDSYVNGMRGNLPFGETASPVYTSSNGFSQSGMSSLPGYSGKVFEPNDEYKGDFARIYFYMATCYEDKIAGWDCDMLDHSSYPAYKDWAVTMLLRWAKEDPVSQKEIDRNNAVYEIQENRNPYVDYPGLEQYVWGEKITQIFDPDNYEGITGVMPGSSLQDPFGRVSVMGLDGRVLRSGVFQSEALQGLPAGFYIVDGKKMIVCP